MRVPATIIPHRLNQQLHRPLDPQPRNSREPRKGRILFVLGATAYIALLQWIYIEVVSDIFGYFGYVYIRPPDSYWAAFSLLALLPALWIPIKLTRSSQWLYLYLYATVHVPTSFVPLFRSGYGGPSPERLIPFVLVETLCMAVLALIYAVPLMNIRRLFVVHRQVYWAALGAFLIVTYSLVYLAFRDTLRLADFFSPLSVLDQRFAGRDIVQTSFSPLLLGYSLSWPTSAINPFLIALGLWKRRWLLVALGVAGQVYLYMPTAARGGIGSAGVLLIVLAALRLKRVPFGVTCIWVFAAIILFSGAVCMVSPSQDQQVNMAWAVSRTFIGPGLVTGRYYDYFSYAPLTFFSHLRGLGWITKNPYQDTTLGLAVGASIRDPQNNMVGNLWAEGFASLGFPGMIIVAFVTGGLFYAMDSLLKNADVGFATLAICYHGMNVSDMGIFSTFLGAGLGLSAILVYLMPPFKNIRTEQTSRRPLDAIIPHKAGRVAEQGLSAHRGARS